MYGLINRAIEMFVRDTYGRKVWQDIVALAGLDAPEFEPMQDYPDTVTKTVMASVARRLSKTVEEVSEDIGTYIVSHPSTISVRRLLRFSGADFVEFLHSLDDLPARARLAVPELILPSVELREHGQQRFSVNVGGTGESGFPFGFVLIGLLRAMADDYGALVLLEHKGRRGRTEIVEVHLLEAEFSEGRHFALGAVE